MNFEVDERTAVTLRLLAIAEDSSIPEVVRSIVRSKLEELILESSDLRESVERMLRMRSEKQVSKASVTDIESKKRATPDGS